MSVFIKDLVNNILENTDNIPDVYPEGLLDDFGSRECYTNNISWCLISKKWIDPLYEKIKGSNCIEVYAGRGLISKLLQDRGLNIKPYDDFSWKHMFEGNPYMFTEVEDKPADVAVKEYEGKIDYIIASWIPYEDNKENKSSIKFAKAIKYKHPEATLIYIGEGIDGCNACFEFFQYFDYINFGNKLNKNFQQWEGIHDHIEFMKVRRK